MARQPFSDYLATKDASLHERLIAIDAAISKAAPGVDTAIKWKQYMYSFDSKWMSPVCTIDTTKKGIVIRFMVGADMSDPLGVLRFADSSMGSWDIAPDDKLKVADIGRYVREAVKIRKQQEKK